MITHRVINRYTQAVVYYGTYTECIEFCDGPAADTRSFIVKPLTRAEFIDINTANNKN